ncbi:MAG: hypothetical protein N2441_06860 [Rhodocyclaceae bacterium]|nr:hypothetical protein [Rhodocyclaceae bacterium]
MRFVLIAINVLLLFALVWTAFFWQPEFEQTSPLPGTHAARQGKGLAPDETVQK